MSKNDTTNVSRRGFLAGVGAVAAAAPLTAAGTAPSSAEPRHDPLLAEADHCDCRSCRRARRKRGSNPLLLAVLTAAAAADAALDRFLDEHCAGPLSACDVCADAAGCQVAVWRVTRDLEGDVVGRADFEPRHVAARRPNAALPAHAAALVAMYDLLDALLDLTAGHCGDGSCGVCIDSDNAVYHVRVGLELLGCQGAGGLAAHLAVEERELLSARRKVARQRTVEAAGAPFMPFSGREHRHAAEDAGAIRTGIAVLRGTARHRTS